MSAHEEDRSDEYWDVEDRNCDSDFAKGVESARRHCVGKVWKSRGTSSKMHLAWDAELLDLSAILKVFLYI